MRVANIFPKNVEVKYLGAVSFPNNHKVLLSFSRKLRRGDIVATKHFMSLSLPLFQCHVSLLFHGMNS